jgi:hypothetical protein
VLEAIKEVGLKVNTEKTKCGIYMSHYNDAGQYYNKKIVNKSVKNVAKLKYVGMVVTNLSFIHKEIKSKLNSVNACYHVVQNLFCVSAACQQT